MAHSAEQIASELRQRIDSGELQPGDRLPTMDAITEQYSVSRQTARNALNILKNEGLVIYRGGASGTTVRRRPTERMIRSRGMERDNLGYYSGANVQHWRLVEGTRTEVVQEPVPPTSPDTSASSPEPSSQRASDSTATPRCPSTAS